jgi:hypothetical protein
MREIAMHSTDQRPPEWALALKDPAQQVNITARTTRRAATLERSSPRLVKTAERAGVDITYLGIAPLFAEPRAYVGPQTDWIITPAADASDAIVPAAERDRLHRLVHAGIDFPLVYVAHEIPKGRLAIPAGTIDPARLQPVTLDHAAAAQAVGPVPPPPGTTTLAEQLGHSSQRLLTVLRAALPIAGAIAAVPFLIAAAPFVAAGAAVAAIVAGLDPIVFGVIPAGDPVPGQPAAWYILAQWAWSDNPDPCQHQPSASSPL